MLIVFLKEFASTKFAIKKESATPDCYLQWQVCGAIRQRKKTNTEPITFWCKLYSSFVICQY